MLELGKQGQKAPSLTDTLLDAAKSDDRLIRQSILLALPKIAKVPCDNCEAKLDAAIKAGEGKTTLGDLNLETTMLRNYFAWAGGKTPSLADARRGAGRGQEAGRSGRVVVSRRLPSMRPPDRRAFSFSALARAADTGYPQRYGV